MKFDVRSRFALTRYRHAWQPRVNLRDTAVGFTFGSLTVILSGVRGGLLDGSF